MKRIRPFYMPPIADEPPDSSRLILRDGTTATIRIATPQDEKLLQRFIDRLSPESRRHRFFSETVPAQEVIRALCDTSQPQQRLTLIVTRMRENQLHIIAAGSYSARDATSVEVGIAVDDHFHGKGLGTLLLERLAMLAIRHGFTRLWAVTHAGNLAMREVFRESGYETRERYAGADMEVELSLLPTETTVVRSELREKIATIASLRPFFHPRAVAVIGASRDPKSIGYRIVEALTVNRFQGAVYPVNPYAAEIAGCKAYPSLEGIPETIDLAVIVVPRDLVLSVTQACARSNIRTLVVISAGFAEVGPEGKVIQDRLLTTVRQHGMRMIGPNCFGLLNTDPSVRLNATFTSTFPPAGRVAMSSQSGALGLAVLAAARRLHLGLSSFVSVGNKADVSTNDLLQYWEEDPSTDVVLLYVESFGNPHRFARIARRVSRSKPIIAVKAGRSQAGRRAAGSHTAALAASDIAVEALFQQTGVIRAETLEELFALATGLAYQPLPPGRRVGIITNAGGPGILCADACEAEGLTVSELSVDIKSKLTTFLPFAASVKNPVDLVASATPDHYAGTIEALLTSGEIDALLVLYMSVTVADTGGIADGILRGIAAARNKGCKDKPVLIVWMAEGDLERAFTLPSETLPTFALPEIPAHVLAKAVRYAEWRAQPLGMIPDFDDVDVERAHRICTTALTQREPGWLTTEETRAVLSAMRLPVSPGGIAHSAEEAAALAKEIGFPVAVKLASHRIVHKTEIGGVRLNLSSESAVREAFGSIRQRLVQANDLEAMEGVLVQPMVAGGVEVMIGSAHDPLFGPLLAFGLGGIHVEILGDVRFRITPLTDRDAAEMVREIKGFRLLQGYRGHPPADVEAIEELLLRVSRLVEEIPEIIELDLNPIFALPPGQGCRIVDARIRVGSAGGDGDR